MLTAEQRQWTIVFLKPVGGAKFGDLDAGPPRQGKQNGADGGRPHGKHAKAAPDEAQDGASGAAPDEGFGDEPFGDEPGTTRALSLPTIPSVIPDLVLPKVKDATDPRFAHCIVDNQTDQVLLLDAASIKDLAHGEWKKKPPGQVAPKKKEVFEGESSTFLSRTVTGVEGTVRYFVGDKGTTWDLHFDNPFVGTNTADATLAGGNKDKYNSDYDAKDGIKGTFTFTLSNAGGGGTQPQPNAGGSQTSCLVTIANQTQSTLYLRKQDKASGDYMTNPPTSLAPGASTQFAFIETPGSNQAELRGLMTWDVGDPKVATWELMWDNPTGQKNYTRAALQPEAPGLHSLDQIGQGDENVPVTFTLSGGGTGPTPQTGKGTSCEVTIVNNTQSALTLAGQTATDGEFTGKPPAKIDAGATVTMASASKPNSPDAGCGGVLTYAIGSGQVWTIAWENPPGQANTCETNVGPDGSAFDPKASIGQGDEKVPVTFTLSGGGDGPPPPPAEEEFAPPPKSKQPTLRKGDESPDGWVEYAQERLNDFGAGLQVNGKFDGKMEAAVRKFQADQHCQKDGVIGNETWSALRIGPREAVGTDGRKPHTFEQTDAEARFYYEAENCVFYFKKDDQLAMRVVSTGEQSIEDGKVVVKVTRPDGASKTVAVKVGKDVTPSPDGQGNEYTVRIGKFTKVFGYDSPDHVEGTSVDTYLDTNLGGDRWTGKLAIG